MDKTEKNREWRIVVLSSFVVVVFFGLLDFIFYENLINQGVFFLYLFGFTLLPLALYGIDHYSGFFTKTGGITISGWVALLFNLLFCFKMALSPEVLSLSSGVFNLIMAYLILIILRGSLFKNNTIEISIGPTATVVASAAVLVIILLGFLNTFIEHMWFDSYDGIAIEIPRWGGWPAVLVGVFAVFSGYILWGTGRKNADKCPAWTLWICVSPILLFSMQTSFDLDHYDAFVGPAIAVLHGRIPLLDVFSQYGLGYLLFTLAFLVLPNTYAVCVGIVSLVNIVAFVVYLLILRTLIKNPYHFSLIGIVSVLGVYFCNSMSVNVLPSSLGFRYVPAMLFLYFLVQDKEEDEDKLTRKINIGLLLLNAFWSIECLIFYFLIAGFYCWLKTHAIRAVFKSLAELFAKLLLAIMVFCGLYFLLFKQFPSYGIYLEHPLSYLTGRHDAGSFTQGIGQFTGRYLFFLPMVLVSMMFFYCSMFFPKKNNINPILNRLYLVNFSGVIFLVYIAVHSFVYHIKTEWILFLPTFFGAVFLVKEESRNAFFRFLSTMVAWMTCLMFFCVFLTRIVYVAPSNTGVNDALIYHLIHFKKEVFKNFWYNINHFCNIQHYSKDRNDRIFVEPFQYACKKYGFHQDMNRVIEKYYKNKKEALIFSVSVVEVLFEHNKYHPIFINPMNDISVDATQRDIVLQKIGLIKEGDVVVVDKNIGLDLFQKNVLALLWRKFGFDKIEETPNLWVFKLSGKLNHESPWFLSKRNFTSYIGRNAQVDYRQHLNVKNTDVRSYFYRGDVMTIELDFDTPFLMTAVKFWHLFNSKDIIKNRFFSDDEIKNFNILVSRDRKKWDMLVSENNYFINDKKYYYKDITPITTKYVRLNVLMDNPKIIIPDLEIFGENEPKEVLHSGH